MFFLCRPGGLRLGHYDAFKMGRGSKSIVGNNDVLDIVVYQNIRLSHASVFEILDSDPLQIVFHILYNVTTNQLLEPLENFTALLLT
jgi:hypothetical protein